MAPEPTQPTPGKPALTAPAVVLDTNVVLDWLLFANPSVGALVAAIEQGRARWLATSAMRAELAHVIARGGFTPRWRADARLLLEAWDRHAQPVDAAPAQPLLLCRDLDDQKFIDLALFSKARWLVSRDRDVLQLTRRAARLGLRIAQPQAWCAEP